jgi:hypothetical protein
MTLVLRSSERGIPRAACPGKATHPHVGLRVNVHARIQVEHLRMGHKPAPQQPHKSLK